MPGSKEDRRPNAKPEAKDGVHERDLGGSRNVDLNSGAGLRVGHPNLEGIC